MLDKTWLRSFVIQTVGQLKVGKTKSQTGGNVGLDNLYPDGGYKDNFRLTSPFGFISGIPQGVAAFYHGLFGSSFESITLGFIDSNRPAPSGPGETVLYSTDSAGQSIQVKIVLGTDGTLTITSPTKVVVNSPQIMLGLGGEKTVNGETFMADYLAHTHQGNMGVATSPPVGAQGLGSYLSQKVTAEK